MKFEVGKTYATRSICDHECIYAFEVVARTEKTVTLKERGEKTTRRGIYLWDGIECCNPHGRYSMAPVLRSTTDRVVA